ncbi:hypothetical protein LCGC14_0375850 [marine sediment metagenome]|uniref:Uncharacterized protein n=1 Tax=marine sediment metagenome TaxID=412755 RepID=A0A0F9TLV4_9ZZZZ
MLYQKAKIENGQVVITESKEFEFLAFWVQFNPDRLNFPHRLKASRRSVYFPEDKAHIFWLVKQVIKEIDEASFNDVVAESLLLWLDQTKQKYLEKLHARLSKRLKRRYCEKTKTAIIAMEKAIGFLLLQTKP